MTGFSVFLQHVVHDTVLSYYINKLYLFLVFLNFPFSHTDRTHTERYYREYVVPFEPLFLSSPQTCRLRGEH